MSIAESLIDRYLGESAEDIAGVLKSLKRKLGREGTDDVETQGKTITGFYKNSDFFTPRDSEEDDDFPNFTGRDKVKKIVDSSLSQFKKEIKSISIDDDEKSWFTVSVTIK